MDSTLMQLVVAEVRVPAGGFHSRWPRGNLRATAKANRSRDGGAARGRRPGRGADRASCCPTTWSFSSRSWPRHGRGPSRRRSIRATRSRNFASTWKTPAPRRSSLPPGDHPAREAARQLQIPIWECGLDAQGTVFVSCERPTGSAHARHSRPTPRPTPERCRPVPAHQRHHQPAEGRAAHARQPDGVDRQHRGHLSAHAARPQPDRHAALSRPWPDRRDAVHAAHRRGRGGSREILRRHVLADGGQVWRHLVLRGADHPSDSAGPGRSGQRPARRLAFHPLVQLGPGAGGVSPDWKNASALRCWKPTA